MHRNRRNISDRLHIPDLTEQLFFRENAVRILRKEGQQIELFRCKLLLLSVHPHAACRLVNLDAADLHNIILFLAVSDQTVVPCQMRFHARNQLTRGKRFRHIVIRTKAQSADFVDIILLCRNHDNRNILLLAHLTADLKAIHLRQHQIQNQQIKILFDRPHKTGVPLVFNLHFKARKLQIILLQIRNGFLILNNQYLTHETGTSWYFLNTKYIVVPTPSLLVAHTFPPWSSRIFFTMERPMPLPPLVLLRDASVR